LTISALMQFTPPRLMPRSHCERVGYVPAHASPFVSGTEAFALRRN
jgi:hypothetical protein